MLSSEPFQTQNPYMFVPKLEPMDDTNTNTDDSALRWLPYPSEHMDPHQLQPPLIATVCHRFSNKKNDSGCRRNYVAWSKRETAALVQWLDSQESCTAMKRNTAQLLPQMAEDLQTQIPGCTKTAKQCDHKIRNLKKCYKKVKEMLSRTSRTFDGADPEVQEEVLDQFPYFREFERIMREAHTVKSIPSALLKLAADGKCAKRKPEDDFDSASNTPALSPQEPGFPDMSRFQSIRCKEEGPAKSIPTPESCSPHTDKTAHCSPPLQPPPPAMSPEHQPEPKRQRLDSSGPQFFCPYQMLDDSAVFPPDMEVMPKCDLQVDSMENLAKCPINLDMPTDADPSLFNPTAFIDTPDSETCELPEENTHTSLLNMLKAMAQSNNATDSELTDYEEPTSQQAALIMAEHVRAALAKKEATHRRVLYLNYLQSQIERHTARVELLYNNGEASRATQALDKIDELEGELHEALNRPVEQF